MRKIYFLFVCLLSASLASAQEQGFKWLREIHCPILRPYQEGRAAFVQDEKWGFVDKEGKVVIPPLYDTVGDFTSGVAIACLGGKWGVINLNGQAVFDFKYSEISDFSNGIALAKEGEKWAYIMTNGKTWELSSKFQYYPFKNGYARVKQKDKWGYINTEGIFTIEPKYKEASDFSGGLAVVIRAGEPYYINVKGNQRLLPVQTPVPLVFSEGMAVVQSGDLYTYMDSDFKLLPDWYKKAAPFREGLAAVVTQDDRCMYIDKSGKKAFDTPYENTGSFSEGKAWVGKRGKYGYIDKNGQLVIDTLFSSASDFSDGLAYVSVGSRKGIIKPEEEGDLIPQAVIKQIALSDDNHNGQVEAEEAFQLKIKLANPGSDTLKDAWLSLAGNPDQMKWFDYEESVLKGIRIAPHRDTILAFTAKAKMNLVSEDIQVACRVDADNLFQPVMSEFKFPALGINACKPLLEKYWVYKYNHTPLAPGDKVNLRLTVVNQGKDLAKDVKIALNWPDSVRGKENVLSIPVLRPGETTEVITSFTLDSILPGNNFTIVANVSEYTQQHNDIKYLTFESGRMNSEMNVLTGSSVIYQYAAEANPVLAAQAPQMQKSELLEGLQEVNAPDPNKYALVIGNEDYNSFKMSATYEQNVDFAAQDAEVFAAYAKDVLGVPAQNVLLLKNATYAQMNFNLDKLTRISKTKPGQIELYVYYAGHGQHDVETKETYLIPVDVSISAPTAGIKLDKVYAMLSNSEAKRTMVFLDACYSGVGRGIVIKPKDTPIQGNMVVLTATTANQRSMPYQEKHHGMFTYFLLKALQESKGQISIGDLYKKVRESVQKNSIWINNTEQTPELLKGNGVAGDWETWKLY